MKLKQKLFFALFPMALISHLPANTLESHPLPIEWQSPVAEAALQPPIESLLVWQVDSDTEPPKGKLPEALGQAGTVRMYGPVTERRTRNLIKG